MKKINTIADIPEGHSLEFLLKKKIRDLHVNQNAGESLEDFTVDSYGFKILLSEGKEEVDFEGLMYKDTYDNYVNEFYVNEDGEGIDYYYKQEEISMREVEFNDQKVFIVEDRVDTVDEGLYKYELRHSDEDWGLVATIEDNVVVNFYGTLICEEPIEFEEYYVLDEEERNLLSYQGEFVKKEVV